DGAVPGGAPRIARPDGQRPCRRAGAALMPLSSHLMILPVLLPLAMGAVLLLLDERRHILKAVMNFASTAGLMLTAIALLRQADTSAAASGYLLGNWPAPFGI